MDEGLDNDLKNRISEVFENYEDTGADEGWLLLRKKFPERRNRRTPAWLWWGAAAAILLLFLTVGLLVNNSGPQPKKFTGKVLKKSPGGNFTVQTPVNAAATHKADSAGKLSPTTTPAKDQQYFQPAPAYKARIKGLYVKQGIKYDEDNAGKLPPSANKNVTAITPKPADINKVEVNMPAEPQIAAVETPVTTKAPDSVGAKTNVINPKPTPKSMAELLAQEPVSNSKKQNEKTVSRDKKVHFGVYAGTYFNYGKGSGSNVNVGAGFSSDINISKNLKFSTGLAVAQNSLNYNNTAGPAPAASSNFLKTASNSKTLAVSSAYSLTIPVLTNYNASLVGLDVPLNLKYEFNPDKNDTYISAGLSSGTFINESYTYHYKYSQFTPLAQQIQDESTRKTFNSFYFAKTLNLAFGVGYPLGKSNRLVIEPFLKYPLDGLGSQQLRFGAGGVNLKFNFKSSKK